MTAATPITASFAHRIAQLLLRVRAVVQARRGPLGLLAGALFLGGAWYSLRHLGITPSRLAMGPLLAQLALAPLSMLYAGVGLQLLLRSAGSRIGLGKAMAVSAWATLAEVLPVPGGAMVRTGALVNAGARLGTATALVLATAILWISLAALGCGLALMAHEQSGAVIGALAGLAGAGIATTWLVRSAGWRIGALSLIHRIVGMALIALRLHFAFLTFAVALPLADALPFALANIAGTAASIAPSGLGISESLAALIAPTVSVTAAAAFVAVGLDRLVCLAASAVVVLVTMGRFPAAEPAA